jgi:hypothetical protein
MCGMDLDHLRPSFQRPAGGVGKRAHDALDPAVIQIPLEQCRPAKTVADLAQRSAARRLSPRPHVPRFSMARGHARFPASVRELHAGNSALGFDEPKNQREYLDLFVFPKSQIFRTDASFRQDCRCFRHDERRAADRATAEMHEMPVIREPFDA